VSVENIWDLQSCRTLNEFTLTEDLKSIACKQGCLTASNSILITSNTFQFKANASPRGCKQLNHNNEMISEPALTYPSKQTPALYELKTK